jgi:hypothetical protein
VVTIYVMKKMEAFGRLIVKMVTAFEGSLESSGMANVRPEERVVTTKPWITRKR